MDNNYDVPSIRSLSEQQYLEKLKATKKQNRETITDLINLLKICDRECPSEAVRTESLLLQNRKTSKLQVIRRLGTIALTNLQALEILVEILTNGKVLDRYLVAQTLSKVAIGNENVIIALIKIIYSSQDKVSLNCTTTILGNIAKDRPHAVRALIYLLKNNHDLAQKLILAQKLNQIAEGHPQVIIAWLDIIANGKSYASRRSAIQNLSQVTVGNQIVIAELKKIANKKGQKKTVIDGKQLAKIGLKQIDRSDRSFLITKKLAYLLQQSSGKVAFFYKAIAIVFLQLLNFITSLIFNPLYSLRSKKRFSKEKR